MLIYYIYIYIYLCHYPSLFLFYTTPPASPGQCRPVPSSEANLRAMQVTLQLIDICAMNFCRTHNDLLRHTRAHTQTHIHSLAYTHLLSYCPALAEARTRCTVPTRVAVGLSIVSCIAIMLYELSQMARSPRKLVRRAEWGQSKWGGAAWREAWKRRRAVAAV